jgi:hypothetical protein
VEGVEGMEGVRKEWLPKCKKWGEEERNGPGTKKKGVRDKKKGPGAKKRDQGL